MKKLLITTAVMSALVAGVSSAETSLTLYGVLDAGVQYSKEKTTTGSTGRFGFSEGNIASSRFGLKGVENLGAGTSAIFNLEGGFSVTNGASTNTGLFGRIATVGVDDEDFGRLTLGLQTDAADHLLNGDVDDIIDFDQDEFGKLQNREVQALWISPKFAGLQFGFSYGPGGTDPIAETWRNYDRFAEPLRDSYGDIDYYGQKTMFSNTHVAAALSYEYSGLKLSGAVNWLKKNVTPAGGLICQYSHLNRQKEISLGAEYDFQVLAVGVRYQRHLRGETVWGSGYDRDNCTGVIYTTNPARDFYDSLKADRYEITMAVPLHRSGTLYAGVARLVTREAPKIGVMHDGRIVDLLSVGALYDLAKPIKTHFFRLSYVEELSKRSSIYFGYGFKHAKGATVVIENLYSAANNDRRVETKFNSKAHYFTAGLSHRF